jgi:hypothetical protein
MEKAKLKQPKHGCRCRKIDLDLSKCVVLNNGVNENGVIKLLDYIKLEFIIHEQTNMIFER